MKDEPMLSGKIALITGAAGGIGRASALVFAGYGARLVLSDNNVEGGEGTVRLVRANGGDAIFVKADVRQASEVEALVAHATSEFGRLDCAFNNAGVEGTFVPAAEITEDVFDEVLSVNLKGVWLCMKYELQQMLKQGGGAIVNNSSIAGLVGHIGVAAYGGEQARGVGVDAHGLDRIREAERPHQRRLSWCHPHADGRERARRWTHDRRAGSGIPAARQDGNAGGDRRGRGVALLRSRLFRARSRAVGRRGRSCGLKAHHTFSIPSLVGRARVGLGDMVAEAVARMTNRPPPPQSFEENTRAVYRTIRAMVASARRRSFNIDKASLTPSSVGDRACLATIEDLGARLGRSENPRGAIQVHESENGESTPSILERNLAVKTPRADRYFGPRDEYAGIAVRDRKKILRLAADLLPEVARKTSPFPMLGGHGEENSSRAPFRCLLAAASLHSYEGFGFAPMVDFATAMLLTFGFDDIIEGVDGENRIDQLQEFYSEVSRIAADPEGYRRNNPTDVTHAPYQEQLYSALADWLADLPREVCDDESRREIGEQLKVALRGMISERYWSRDHTAWPSLEEYLRVGTDTSCNLFLWDVPRIYSGIARDAQALNTYRTAVNHLGTCIRVYNDLCTTEREALSGEPSTVKILDASGMEENAVFAEILGIADAHAAHMASVIDGFPDGMRALGKSIIQYHDFLRAWYLARDTNHYTADELPGAAARADSHTNPEVVNVEGKT
jgi:NADP-dependent 3-hydroxy acid dehydrogenase YdfG